MLETDSVYLAVTMSARGKSSYALLRLPTDRSSRFVELPPAAGVGKKRLRVVWLDDAIRVSLPDIFGQFGFERFTAHTVKLTRSAEISDDDFVWNFSEQFSRTIKQRAHGRFVRLIYDQEMPRVTLRRLVKQLQLGRDCSLVAAGRITICAICSAFRARCGAPNWRRRLCVRSRIRNSPTPLAARCLRGVRPLAVPFPITIFR